MEGTVEMSGGETMYTLKPIVSLPTSLYHSNTVYQMQNIHATPKPDPHTASEPADVPDITQQVTSFLKLQVKLPDFVALEARQDKILAQLVELKKQVSSLRTGLKRPIPSVNSVSANAEVEYMNLSVVVNANPARPPYSILAIETIWKNTNVTVKSFVHSSTKQPIPLDYNQRTREACDHRLRPNTVNISLIWKEVEDLEVIFGFRSYCVKGESNFLRYLSRMISKYSYENTATYAAQMNRFDAVLDLCHRLQHEQMSTNNKREILTNLNKKLHVNSSAARKDAPTIADVIAWSTLKKVFQKNIPSAFNEWFRLCERVFT